MIKIIELSVTTQEGSSGHHVWVDLRLKKGSCIEVQWGDGNHSTLFPFDKELSRAEHYYKKYDSEETYLIELSASDPGAILEYIDGTRELKLNSIRFLNCPSLHKINISHLPAETDFSDCSVLEELETYNCYCRVLDLHSAPNLRRLSCGGSGFLEQLILSGNDRLEIIECQVNPRLTKIAISNRSPLRKLKSYMTEIDSRSMEWISKILERNNRK